MYTFRYTDTAKDLVEFHKEVARRNRGVGPAIRWTLVGMGFLFAFCGFLALTDEEVGFKAIIWIAIGFGLLWVFPAKPMVGGKENQAQ